MDREEDRRCKGVSATGTREFVAGRRVPGHDASECPGKAGEFGDQHAESFLLRGSNVPTEPLVHTMP
jgi:hypothetical protein